MPYDRLRRHLADAPSPRLSTLPDGSVDHYCRLSAGALGPLQSRQTLGRELADTDRATFRMTVESTEPGGQAVNVAQQVHALDGEVTCYGHLDHAVLADLPFETVSMGEPATVYAFNFADGDVMFADNAGLEDWALADLEAVADLDTVFSADAVCCSNWISLPKLGEAFHELGTRSLPRRPFVFDPGDIVGSDPAAIESLHRALAALQETVDVVYNANRQEIRASAATLAETPADDHEKLRALREATGVAAVVLHAADEAAAATGDGVTAVENRRVDTPDRFTGGGDRFSGGLAVALAAGWDWPVALACGNACASHYVETGETATVSTLREDLDRA